MKHINIPIIGRQNVKCVKWTWVLATVRRENWTTLRKATGFRDKGFDSLKASIQNFPPIE
jgi:hypothetical protein